MTVSLPIRDIRGNSGPSPKSFPEYEDLVVCDASEGPGNTIISEETEDLKDSKVIQEQIGSVRLPEPGPDRTPVMRRETSAT